MVVADNLARVNVVTFAHTVLPVTDDGLRAAVIPVVGFETTRALGFTRIATP